jgi:putative membrane protein
MIKGIKEIFSNDVKAVRKSPIVLIVLLGIMLIPSMYALLNIEASWDPYGSTSNLKIAVVNEDAGQTVNGTYYNIGQALVEELKNNTNFKWQFTDETTALENVKYGKYYAAIIIPSNFTEDILSIDTATPHQAKIRYVINDKLNPIAPRLTGTGVGVLQEQINDEIVKTVDGLIFGKLINIGNKASDDKAKFLELKNLVNDLNGNLNNIDSTLLKTTTTMNTLQNAWAKLSSELPVLQSNSNYVKTKYDTLYYEVKNNPGKALETISDIELKVNDIITSLNYVHAILKSLYDVTGDQRLVPIINEVETDINKANTVLTILVNVESDIKNSNTSNRMAELKTSIDEMDSAINILANNQATINQAVNHASSTLSLTSSNWPEFKNGIQLAALKINSVSEADLDKLIALSDINSTDVEDYFSSPVVLETEHMYRVDVYGSAIAPFFIALSLWIGAAVSVSMLKVTTRRARKYNSTTIYFGRMGIFLLISIFQALIVAMGAILLVKVQITSAMMMVLCTIYIGLCFMTIVYSLTSAFGEIGKFLAVLLLVLQVAGSGGTYPAQVLTPLFQYINPYLPFTYAISAIREIVAGVLWTNFWYSIGVLTLFPILTVALTLLVKEKLSKTTENMEEQLKESDLFN